MKRLFPILFVAMWLAFGLSQIYAEELFAKAAQSYEKKDFTQAEKYYRQALAEGEITLPILYNLANACAEQGKLGQAILNYERVLAQNPRHALAKQNLSLVRQRVGLPSLKISWWRWPFVWLNLNTWTWLASLCLAAFAAVFLLYIWKLEHPVSALPLGWCSIRILRYAMSVIAIGLGLGILGVGATLPVIKKAIVVHESTPLHISPFESATTTTLLHEGEALELTSYFPKPYQGFWSVRTQEGKMGWVAQKNFERVAWFERKEASE